VPSAAFGSLYSSSVCPAKSLPSGPPLAFQRPVDHLRTRSGGESAATGVSAAAGALAGAAALARLKNSARKTSGKDAAWNAVRISVLMTRRRKLWRQYAVYLRRRRAGIRHPV